MQQKIVISNSVGLCWYFDGQCIEFENLFWETSYFYSIKPTISLMWGILPLSDNFYVLKLLSYTSVILGDWVTQVYFIVLVFEVTMKGVVSQIFFLNPFCHLYMRAIDFCQLILFASSLLKVLFTCCISLWDFRVSCVYYHKTTNFKQSLSDSNTLSFRG